MTALKVSDNRHAAYTTLSEVEPSRTQAPLAWQYHGHPWLQRRVRRVFGSDVVDGKVVAYIPAGPHEDEPALWHVMHDDGDEEDLEEGDTREAIRTHEMALSAAAENPMDATLNAPGAGYTPDVHSLSGFTIQSYFDPEATMGMPGQPNGASHESQGLFSSGLGLPSSQFDPPGVMGPEYLEMEWQHPGEDHRISSFGAPLLMMPTASRATGRRSSMDITEADRPMSRPQDPSSAAAFWSAHLNF